LEGGGSDGNLAMTICRITCILTNCFKYQISAY
jgi:hypothetical protein